MDRSYSTRSRTASSSALVAAMAVTWLMCPEALLIVRSLCGQHRNCPHPKSGLRDA